MSWSSLYCSITLAIWHFDYVMELNSLLNYFGSMTYLLMSWSSLSYLIILASWHLAYVVEITFFCSITLAWNLAYVMEFNSLLNYFGSMISYLYKGAQLFFAQLLWLHDILLMSWNSIICSITMPPWHLTYIMELTFCSITLALGHLAYVMELNSKSISLAPWYLVGLSHHSH